jgi:hypothetical protein
MVDDDIIDIRLVPAWDSPSIRSILGGCIRESQLLQAAIAYWTVDDSVFGHPLAPRISAPNGFLCVDLHMPTDIDALAALVRDGAHVRLYCEDITTYRGDGKEEPPFLMHAKMLLFWKSDKTAELWVGSHNWTNRAVMGLNIESSLVIRLKDSSALFYEAAEYLQKIKAICQPFDLSRVDWYKELQKDREGRTTTSIDVEAPDASDLAGLEVSIFGTDEMDFEDVRAVRQKVYLAATDSIDETEHIYPAEINGVHRLNSANPSAGKIAFSPRRYAFRAGRKGLPVLMPVAEVSADVLTNARYYVNLELKQRRDDIRLDYPRGRTVIWGETDEQRSPLIRRLNTDEMQILFRGRPPQVAVPTEVQPEPFRAMTLDERRNLPERSLITRRVVRRR